MKKTFCTLFVAFIALTIGTSAHLFANDEAETRRQEFIKGFDQLLKNTEEGLAKPAETGTFKEGNTVKSFSKFSISPVQVASTTNNLGIRVWFTLEDGTAFNPIKRKMGVKERFYVHIQSAVPVFVSLFQNYPDSNPESRQVYPDAKYPETLKVIQAGTATKLPVPFEMDDNTLDEIMAMVVVRADAPQIQATLETTTTNTTATDTTATSASAQTTTATGGTPVVTVQATSRIEGTMKSMNDRLAGEKIGENAAKFLIASPTTTSTTVTVQNDAVPSDVAFYMFSTGYAGQWQLTLKK